MPSTSTRRSRDDRTAQIATAARAIARNDGLYALTLRAVAADIGVTPALVAHYAPSMDALTAEAFSSVVGGELDEIRASLEGMAAPTQQMAELLGSLMDGTRADVTRVWVHSWALGDRNEALAAAVREHMDRWQQFFEQLIAAGCAAGEFFVTDVEVAAWQLQGLIDGSNAHSLVRWQLRPGGLAMMADAVEAILRIPPGQLSDAVTTAHPSPETNSDRPRGSR